MSNWMSKSQARLRVCCAALQKNILLQIAEIVVPWEIPNPTPKDQGRSIQKLHSVWLVWTMQPEASRTIGENRQRFGFHLIYLCQCLSWFPTIITKEKQAFSLDHVIDLPGLVSMCWVICAGWSKEHAKHRISLFIENAVSERLKFWIHAVGIGQAGIPWTTSKFSWNLPLRRSSFGDLSNRIPGPQKQLHFFPKKLHHLILCL